MRDRLYQNIKNVNTWVFTGIAILLAVLLTSGLNLFFAWISRQGIRPLTMFFATVDAILIPAIIAPLLLNIVKRAANLEDTNRQLQQEIVERQQAEQAAEQRAANLAMISEMAVACAAVAPETDLPKFIAEKLHALTGAFAVGLSTYEADASVLTTRYVSVSGRILATARDILGRSLVGLTSPVSPEALNVMTNAGFLVVDNLTDITFGAVPRPVSAALQATLGVGSFVALGLCYGGELWGAAAIALRAGQPPLERDHALALANIAAVALRRQKAEESLRLVAAEHERLIAELEAKNAELERFTYSVSHDLKSPLITIRGFLGFLEKDAAAGNAERTRADVAHITEATNKMQRLLDELLELSRVGRAINPPQPVAFEAVAREAVDLVRGCITARGVRVEIAPDLPIVYGDQARLIQVLQNLMDNACKFMGNQPQPCVEIGQRGPDADGKPVLFVRDNGIGIEQKFHDQIFGLFNKLDARTEGVGFGLSLVKRIIEVHGGRIWVESKGNGHGATFCFTLPSPPQHSSGG